MLRKILVAGACVGLLSACETPTTQRYAISPDNSMAIRSLNTSGIAVGTFQAPADFSSTCRALGPLRVADDITHTQYIQKAFQDEIKVAGAFSTTPRVTLNGKVQKLEFSSSRAITGGSWTIDLALASTNGKEIMVNEYYEFDSGFGANDACRQTAEAFSRAVQNLIGKTVNHPQFSTLVR